MDGAEARRAARAERQEQIRAKIEADAKAPATPRILCCPLFGKLWRRQGAHLNLCRLLRSRSSLQVGPVVEGARLWTGDRTRASNDYIFGNGPNPHAGHVWGQGRQRREQAQAQAPAQAQNGIPGQARPQNAGGIPPPPGRAPMNGIPPPPGRAPGGDRFQNEVDALNEAIFGPGGGQPGGGRGGRAAGPPPARGARAPPNGSADSPYVVCPRCFVPVIAANMAVHACGGAAAPPADNTAPPAPPAGQNGAAAAAQARAAAVEAERRAA
ncbi:hypothetical protein T484DRAFT_2025013, partial [Baffinella frigidus]